MLAGLVGFAGGSAVVVAALVFELRARGLPMRGSLWDLQTQSVAVWVLESVPFLIAFAAISMAAPVPEPPTERASPPPRPVPPPPPPLQGKTAVPVDPTPAAPDPRTAALEELVKVLRSSSARAAEESRAKSTYLASMSQSFREPLNEIIGQTQALLEQVDDDAAPSLRQAHAAARHLAGIVNNMLDISKIEIGAMSVVLEVIDLAQVVDEAQAGLGPAIDDSDSDVTMSVDDAVRFARGDHMRVRQIVVNLMSHALAESQGGTVSLTAEAVSDSEGEWVAVRVADAGDGMTEEETERVLDDYRPSSEQMALRLRTDGGLGLSLSRKLADLIGGRLLVESELGSGSTFSLILPRAAVDPSEVVPRSSVALGERLVGRSLLLLDHDAAAASHATYLEEAGLEVEVADPEASAAEAIEGKSPNIAILGAEVPDVWAAAKVLIEQDVHVIVLSLRDDDVEMALQLGVTGFLVRPVDRAILLATLERCLEEE